MRIRASSAIENGLLLMGAPLEQGVARPGQGWELRLASGARLPLWWAERAFWPDGSVKWLWLHARVPAGRNELALEPADGPTPAAFSGLSVSADKAEARAGGFRFSAGLDAFSLELNGSRLVVEDEGETFEPALAAAQGPRFFEVLEDSALAPLIRLRDESRHGVRREGLWRVDAERGGVVWTRRVSLMSGPRHDLRRMSATLSLEQGAWRLAAAPGARRVVAPRPHRFAADGVERPGHPEALLEGDGAAALLVKGWQRAPFGLEAGGGKARLDLFPLEAPALAMLQGTSFRHETRLALGKDAAAWARAETRWSWDASAAASGAMGPLAPRDEDVKRYYPGFDRAFESAILHCRPTRLDKPGSNEPVGPAGDLADETSHDEEFFGLGHYGDWPMPLGSYGGKRRMYVDNEYDVAYALFQHFARTGRWEILDLARHSALHMTDVDFMAHAADMRFHGYSAYAENHAEARSGGDGGHYWTDGYWLLHFVEGDPWARENALALTERIVNMYAAGEDVVRAAFTGCERVLGWCMVAMCGAAENAPAPEAVATMERMSRYVAQYMRDPDAEFDGVDTISGKPAKWWRAAAQDGCKPFMLGVLMEGLERYHRLSGSSAAREALVAVACFLRDVMWSPTAAAFEYERNAYNLRHRDVYPHSLNLLVTRGLAYAHEVTGDESLRRLTIEAAYGGLWTVFESSTGKEIGLEGRTSGATLAYLDLWRRRDEAARAARMAPSHGVAFRFAGAPAGLLRDGALRLRKGAPDFDATGGLIGGVASFAVCDAAEPWNTDQGRVALEITPSATVAYDGGGSVTTGWAALHLCGDSLASPAITVMHFYDGLHVRFHDAERKLIGVLEAKVDGWPAGERRRFEFSWTREEAVLWVDGREAHRIPMGRRLSGVFRRVSLGAKPGNWRLAGTLHRVEIDVGRQKAMAQPVPGAR